MLRRSYRLSTEFWSAAKHPGVSRHHQSTFHEGVARDPPKPGRTPYLDAMSPISQAGRLGPDLHMGNKKVQMVVLGSLIAVSYYCFCLSFDIKAHYVMNNTMHRELHLQRAKAEEMAQRCKQLEAALAEIAIVKGGDSKGTDVSASGVKIPTAKEFTHTAANPEGKYSVVNYEVELLQERTRAKELHQQHQALVHELADVRAENNKLKKQVTALTLEAESLQRLVDKYHSVHDGQ